MAIEDYVQIWGKLHHPLPQLLPTAPLSPVLHDSNKHANTAHRHRLESIGGINCSHFLTIDNGIRPPARPS